MAVSSFMKAVDLKLYHYVGLIISGFCGASFFAILAVYGNDSPGALLVGTWCLMMIGVAPIGIRYFGTIWRLPRESPIRTRFSPSFRCWVNVVVPPRRMRELHPWLMPTWIASFVAFALGMISVLVRHPHMA